MHYKVTMQFNWTTNLGFVIISKEGYDECIKKLEKVKDKTVLFAYTADGDDLIAQYPKEVSELLEEFGEAQEISDEDYEVLKNCGCTNGSPIARGLYTQIWDFLSDELGDEE